MAVNLFDAGVALATGIYINSRLNGNRDDGLIRTLTGGATGIFVAYKGPEIINSVKKFMSQPNYSDQRKQLGVAIAIGALTYMVSDPILKSAKDAYSNKTNISGNSVNS